MKGGFFSLKSVFYKATRHFRLCFRLWICEMEKPIKVKAVLYQFLPVLLVETPDGFKWNH